MVRNQHVTDDEIDAEIMENHFKFRPGTIDESVFRAVVERNEYWVPAQLLPDEVVIDIGAHIGSFSWLCWLRGARTIEAFEADLENYQLAWDNLQPTGVRLQQLAVWRSDRQEEVLHHSGYPEMQPDGPDPVGINTGGGHVFSPVGAPIPTISLDAIIGDRLISILKLDCEGSEYPILLTSKKLKQIRSIVGEYHVLNSLPAAAVMDGIDKFAVGVLVETLLQQRFQVQILPHPDQRFPMVGRFFATNMDWPC